MLVKSIIPKVETQAEFLRKVKFSINRNSKVGKSYQAIPATTKPNDKDKAAKATKNKRKKDKKVASKIAPNHSTNSKPSEIYCLKKLKSALTLSTTDCTFGTACRYLHTIPTATNKVEISGIIGHISHPGLPTEKKKIQDALALL
jgi:hypothetical protein